MKIFLGRIGNPLTEPSPSGLQALLITRRGFRYSPNELQRFSLCYISEGKKKSRKSKHIMIKKV